MKINFSEQTPRFESLIKLPELSAEPCHLLRRIFKKCHTGEYNYSPSLDSIFVSGYPKKSWGKQNYVNLKFVQGKKLPVPELLEEATFIADVPEWNGALFRQPSGEALLYDGVKVINLSSDFLRLQNGKSFQNWEIRETAGGRKFIGKFSSRSSKDPQFLMELNAKPGFKPIYLPEDFDQGWLEIFTFSQDPELPLWIITRNILFAEINRRVQTLVRLPSSSFVQRRSLKSLDYDKQNGENVIPFVVRQDEAKSVTNYLLREISDDANCETILDFNQPIILNKIEN